LALGGSTQQAGIGKTQNFRQAGEFYRSLTKQEQANLIANLAADLGQVRNETTRNTMLSYFYKADSGYGQAISKALNANVAEVARLPKPCRTKNAQAQATGSRMTSL
jgi:catalase